jgi:tetratricopeptide (TPR) repeat protein
MAKKIPVKAKPATAKRSASFVLPELNSKGWLFLRSFPFQAIAIVVVGMAFYASTFKNQYALDDDIIMKQNLYVQKGFSGIGEILTNDAYKSYYESMGVGQQLVGGRYRPLSVVTFAIEQQIFGECYGERATEIRDSLFAAQRTLDSLYAYQKQNIDNDIVRHLLAEKKSLDDNGTIFKLNNEKTIIDKKISVTNEEIASKRHIFQVIWFILSMLVLLWLFREHIFRSNTDIAFLTVLLFTIHPIHTEVVANVKSRDEIFSLLFIGLTFIFFFRYDLKKNRKDLIWGIAMFFLALLSKEYAAMMVFLIPASLMIFHKRKVKDLLYLALPFGALMIVYLIIHTAAVGNSTKGKPDVFNEPYLYATPVQTALSKINRLDDYIWLLIYPWPLVSEYYYAHFPYSDITDPGVWLSLLVNIGLVVWLIYLWNRRHPLAFALLLYLGFFILVSNLFFDTGATIGERLIYHSSLGFCMALAWGMVKGVEKLKSAQPYILTGVFLLICIPAFMITQNRNAAWKNDFTLFTNDVKYHPNSGMANGNAGGHYMDIGLHYLGHDTIIGKDTIRQYGRDTAKVHYYAHIAEKYLLRATQIHKNYAVGYLNLGLCYYYTEQYEKAAKAWAETYRIFPSNITLKSYEDMLLGQARNRAAKQDYAGAAKFYHYAAIAVPSDFNAWADYAGSSFMAKDFAAAKEGFNEASKLNPGMTKQLQQGYDVAKHHDAVLTAWKADSLSYENNINLAASYMGTQQFYPEAKRLLNKTLILYPKNPRAEHLLDSLGGLEKAYEEKVNAEKAKAGIKTK